MQSVSLLKGKPVWLLVSMDIVLICNHITYFIVVTLWLVSYDLILSVHLYRYI